MQKTRRRKQKAKKDVARVTKQAKKLKQQNAKTVGADTLEVKS
jgi:hypothetical protein